MDRKFAKGDHRENHPLFAPESRQKILDALEKIRPIAEKHKATLSQLIIQATIQRPGITTALVGARNPAQAIENADASKIVLSPEELTTILETLK
jgi:aryl-alcohol dehydrogenase-like predicted oxidoreductase